MRNTEAVNANRSYLLPTHIKPLPLLFKRVPTSNRASISSSGNVPHGYWPKETRRAILLRDAPCMPNSQFTSTRVQSPLNTLIVPGSSNSFTERYGWKGALEVFKSLPQQGPRKKGRFFLQVSRTKPSTCHKSSTSERDTGIEAADVIESENWAPSGTASSQELWGRGRHDGLQLASEIWIS